MYSLLSKAIHIFFFIIVFKISVLHLIKDKKLKLVLVTSLITDKRLATTKSCILSITDIQVENQHGNLVLAYFFDP